MTLSKRYRPQQIESELQEHWSNVGLYQFSGDGRRPVFAIDTPPPTVSGRLHLGHVYSYSQADFIARYRRMRGDDVLYPMGYDDNGLPTERLVEKTLGVSALDIGRQAFIEKCLLVSEHEERAYQELWQRLGLSIDWRHTYRTIDENSRRLSQRSFLDLYEKDLAYRRKAPAIWCPECQTAIAQAELADLERDSEFVTLPFALDDGSFLPIATTRPELLPACVAIFVHPQDERYRTVIDRVAIVPLFEQKVRVLADPAVDREIGSGAVMCCTFGDTTDVAWWYTYDLDLVEAIGRDGRLTHVAGRYAGLDTADARAEIRRALTETGQLTGNEPTTQSVRVHERCDTPVEYVVAWQWFVKVLDFKEPLLAAGQQVRWHPAHMENRYRQWVSNLNWDWCISRQRYFGVTFPVWYCDDCGQTITADPVDLPIDPGDASPAAPCDCGCDRFTPEHDVMDTWATSSISPQLIGEMLGSGGFDGRPFEPITLHPQAHEIIRTWAFYSIVKSYHHFGVLPWREAAISGWGLAPEGTGKISKSRGGGPMPPLEMIERYSADAVRYWAASTGLGRDATISEEKVQAGLKLANKIWNVARFSQRFLAGYTASEEPPQLSLSDRWILTRLHELIGHATHLYDNYDYATAKSEVETFFWTDLADNYLEMIKKRLYEGDDWAGAGARYALYQALLVTIKLLAPILPHVTEQIYTSLFVAGDDQPSIHQAPWPLAETAWIDESAARHGQVLLNIATAVRRYKSDSNMSLGARLPRLHLIVAESALNRELSNAMDDIASVSRAEVITMGDGPEPALLTIASAGPVSIAVQPPESAD